MYTIKKDDNLSNIAIKNKITVQELQRLNPGIEDPNLIKEGATLKLPSDQPIQPTPEKLAGIETGVKEVQSKIPALTQQVNEYTATAPKTAPKTAEEVSKLLADTSMNVPKIEERASAKVVSDLNSEIEKAVGTDPAVPNLVSEYQGYKKQEGLPDLENEYNTSVSDLRTLENDILSKKNLIKGKAVSSRYINKQLVKLDAENLDALNIAEQKVKDLGTRIDTKNKTISLLMDFAKTDYANASSNYEFKYNKAIQTYNTFSAEQDKAADNARASLKLIQDSIKDGNIDPANLTDYQKQTIQDLEVKAGEPIGITEFLKQNVSEKIFWKGIETDESGNRTLIAIPEKADGTPDMGNTYKIVVGKEDSSKTTIQEDANQMSGFIENRINTVARQDRYLSPDEWLAYKIEWVKSGRDEDSFDTIFQKYKNPKDAYR